MDFALFHSRFPEIAEAETRILTILKHDQLPVGEYALLESYCERPGCDCRRVMLSVLSKSQKRLLAVIAYGWEDEAFYQRWLGDDDPEAISMLRGPVLNRLSRQSPAAPLFLELVVETVLVDEAYVARLKHHYRLFKKALKKEKRNRRTSPLGSGGDELLTMSGHQYHEFQAVDRSLTAEEQRAVSRFSSWWSYHPRHNLPLLADQTIVPLKLVRESDDAPP